MFELIPSNLIPCGNIQYPNIRLEFLAATDDFQFSLFSALHGYYRQAYQALRSALEFAMKGVTLQLMTEKPYDETIKYIKFGKCCDNINNILNNILNMQNIAKDCFRQKNKNDDDPGGWYRQLYCRLSQYPHSNRSFINTEMWNGIGPVFNSTEFDKFTDCYFETVLACIILGKLVIKEIVLVLPFTELLDMHFIQNNPMAQCAINRLFSNEACTTTETIT